MNGITYREDFGCWWPDYDHKPETCFMLVNRDRVDSRVATSLCKKKEICIQAGGHAGFWAMELSKSFQQVLTFEPEPALFECMSRNLKLLGEREGRPYERRILARRLALGDTIGEVMMRPHVSAGSWSVVPEGTVPVGQITVDSLGLDRCDAIFLDVEGYEVPALMGAAFTIQRFRPVIHVEMLVRSPDAIRAHLAGLGYRRHAKMHKDEVYVPR